MEEYLIPKNVKARFEFFEGFGFLELGVTLVGLAAGGLLSGIVYLITESAASILFAGFGAAGGFVASRPIPHLGMNALQLFRYSQKYRSQPKRYLYRFGSGRS